MSIAELLSLWKQADQAQDTAIEAYTEQLADLGDRLAEQVSQMPRLSDGRLVAEASLQMVHRMLTEAGWDSFTRPLESLFGDVATGHMGVLEALGINARPSRLAITRALSFSAGQFEVLHAGLSATLLAQLQAGTVMPISQHTMASVIQEAAQTTKARAKTIANTATAGLQREVATAAMEDLPDDQKRYYLYLGPDDSKARRFCRTLTGKAIPEKALRRLRNGSPLPVARYGGGYNCRHSLIPITETIRDLRNIPVADKSDLARAQRGGR